MQIGAETLRYKHCCMFRTESKALIFRYWNQHSMWRMAVAKKRTYLDHKFKSSFVIQCLRLAIDFTFAKWFVSILYFFFVYFSFLAKWNKKKPCIVVACATFILRHWKLRWNGAENTLKREEIASYRRRKPVDHIIRYWLNLKKWAAKKLAKWRRRKKEWGVTSNPREYKRDLILRLSCALSMPHTHTHTLPWQGNER